MDSRPNSNLRSFTVFALILCACLAGAAQEKEKPKIKDFGSSLKRIRKDEQQKSAVVAKSKSSSTADQIDVIKIETSLVVSDVLVLDAHGKLVEGLAEKDFVISEDGQPQTLGMFARGDDLKMSRLIVLIMDFSISQWPYMKSSVAAAKALVDKLPSSDLMAIVTDDVELIQDFTKDKQKLKKQLDSLLRSTKWPEFVTPFNMPHIGRSKQYSALLATLNEAFDAHDQRPIVILQSDGDEISFLRNSPLPVDVDAIQGYNKLSRALARRSLEARRVDYSLDDICRAAEKARATVYTVYPGYQMLGLPTDEQVLNVQEYLMDARRAGPGLSDPRSTIVPSARLEQIGRELAITQDALVTVANTTGGSNQFLEQPEDAGRIYNNILSDINRRYLVGYYPNNKEHDGKRRKIDVAVRDHPDYKVVGRKWYYAPAADQ